MLLKKKINMQLFLIQILFIFFSINVFAQLETIWSNTCGSVFDEYIRQVHQTSDGGFIMICQLTWSSSYDPCQIYVIKSDSLGNQEWDRKYGGFSYDVPYSISLTSDGGYIIGGESTSFEPKGIFILKINSQGDSLWMKMLGSKSIDHLTSKSSIIENNNGDFFVVGWGWRPPNSNQILLYKLDNQGNIIYEKNFGGYSDDNPTGIIAVKEGGFLITGYTYSYGRGECDGYLLRIDQDGNIIWTNTFGDYSFDSFYSSKETLDGDFISCGSTQSYGNDEQGYIVKSNTSGEMEWFYTFGDSLNENFLDVSVTSDNQYLACGYTLTSIPHNEEAIIVYLDTDGKIIENKILSDPNYVGIVSIEKITTNNYIAGGLTTSTENNSFDVWLLKLKLDPIQVDPILPENPILLQNYPNPFNNSTEIQFILPADEYVRIIIYDCLGDKLFSLVENKFSKGLQQVTFNNSNLSSGVYFYQLNINGFVETRKMVLLK